MLSRFLTWLRNLTEPAKACACCKRPFRTDERRWHIAGLFAAFCDRCFVEIVRR